MMASFFNVTVPMELAAILTGVAIIVFAAYMQGPEIK